MEENIRKEFEKYIKVSSGKPIRHDILQRTPMTEGVLRDYIIQDIEMEWRGFKAAYTQPQPILLHINKKVKELERKTKGVVVLQFAEHPQGMAMIARVYLPSMDKEYSFPDVVLLHEVEKNEQEIKRIDVLFDEIHKALNSIQVIKAGAGGLIK